MIQISKFTQRPGRNEVHVNTPLSNLSIAFAQNNSEFHARTLAPVIPSTHKSDTYYVVPKGVLQRNKMQLRAPGTESQGFLLDLEQDTFSTEVHAAHVDLSEEVLANQDTAVNLESQAAMALTRGALLNRELDWTNKFFSSGVWDTDLSGTATGSGASEFARWSNDDSDPIEDIQNGMDVMHANTGFRPNKLVLGRQVYTRLKQHPAILARLTDNANRLVNKRVLTELIFDDENGGEIVVLDAVYNSLDTFGANANMQFVAGKNALLAHVAPNPGLMLPSAMYTFEWNFNATSNGMAIKTIQHPLAEAERHEIQDSFVHKLISDELGYFFGGAIA